MTFDLVLIIGVYVWPEELESANVEADVCSGLSMQGSIMICYYNYFKRLFYTGEIKGT